ncbi:TPA: hypothetical protein U2I11_004670 [Citrobacter koseri]|uniref:Uncharacterized protein n=1 Tax=Citrobacter koseri TaxID=545 RepID=A0AAW4EJ15_CITKO|nr:MULTISPECIES: hypothetical protein [Enterobacteriaceae]EJK7983608.1 hypothetical protein [Citrobacter koseri]EJK7984459.1 hypothetical protein [Citrobacter koseri]EKV7914731.1 hypothetical protein [Citrobacter koseri]EKV7917074.1 hypothetical protein [Citrobacter koseri]EKW5609557.1 hypothetical protein [Citrobacter koseri]
MSRDYIVYLNTENLPSPSAWKEEILRQGFPCEPDDDINLLMFSGFLSCSVNGEISGFEYYIYEFDEDILSELDSLPSVNYGITFSTGSRKLETIAALAAASCLAKLTGGYFVDFNSGLTLKSDLTIDWAKSQTEIVTGENYGH